MVLGFETEEKCQKLYITFDIFLRFQNQVPL